MVEGTWEWDPDINGAFIEHRVGSKLPQERLSSEKTSKEEEPLQSLGDSPG